MGQPAIQQAPALQAHRGISMLDLAATTAIVVLAGAIIFPRLAASSETAKAKENAHNRAVINAAVERWYIEKGDWPKHDLTDLGADREYFPHGLPINPLDRSGYSLNPTTHRVD
jgi:type II secretory pathway pseudopilin PulG